ncbi:MAG: nucleotidyltransferase domain-containing protein [Clostridiales bacterium]|nr:nucleotidyltransferase domain-containing protein [Clostridiales bacterium]
MTDVIANKLREIEERENVRVLHCVESGSRAWGFASPDSDYDVRFIYVRPAEFYLRLEKTRDVIEWQLDDTLDINGWDLQKALRLLHRSNPTLFEWNSSPIVYHTTGEWREISNVINEYFVKKAGLYHYLSTAKRNYAEFLTGETVKLKKYFYVLRPVLACRWILKYGTPPPMLFDELAADCLEPDMKEPVEKLLALKRETPELGEGRRIDVLNDYLAESIDSAAALIAALPDEESGSWEKLDSLFLSIVSHA